MINENWIWSEYYTSFCLLPFFVWETSPKEGESFTNPNPLNQIVNNVRWFVNCIKCTVKDLIIFLFSLHAFSSYMYNERNCFTLYLYSILHFWPGLPTTMRVVRLSDVFVSTTCHNKMVPLNVGQACFEIFCKTAC